LLATESPFPRAQYWFMRSEQGLKLNKVEINKF